MYGVTTSHLQYEVEAQEATLQPQQVFDQHGSRQFGAKLSGRASDLLPAGR
jgi:hypothetical protein